MADLSFDINDAKGFFKKLLEEQAQFNTEPTSSRFAINCAMNAWHLGEWVYNEFKSTLSPTYPDKRSYLNYLKIQCPSLQIMQDISNGSKHEDITMYVSGIDRTELHEGPYAKEFAREFDVSSLNIFMKDGSKKYFEDELNIVVEFWRNLLQTEFGITV